MSDGDADSSDSSDSVIEIDPDEPEMGSQSNLPPQSEKRTTSTNIVMVDDMRMLKELAEAARKIGEAEAVKAKLKTGLSLIPSLKSTSGVTITPAKPRTLPLGGTLLGSGVTLRPLRPSLISAQPRQKFDVPLPAGTTLTSVKNPKNTGNGGVPSWQKEAQLKDPNLTDDTFVVEAPSFIAPYVYEKPPKETFKEFNESVEKLIKIETGNEEAQPEADDKGKIDKTETKPAEEETKPTTVAEKHFESALGKFIGNLGMNLVQERVQHDLLREQTRKSQKDKSAVVMHAIILLKKNLETSKEKNEPFHFELKRCRMCSFKTESILSLENHIEVPHLRNGSYRCYHCPEEAKNIYEMINHMALVHGKRGRNERQPATHQCPQCPFEDNLRGKVNRHKIGCDKRFRCELNQNPPHDWEPPAKIPKPSPLNRMMKTSGFGTNISMAGTFGLGALGPRPGLGVGFNGINPASFQNISRPTFSNMPQLQFGPKGRGRPVGSYKPGFQPGLQSAPNFPIAPKTINQLEMASSSNQSMRLNNSGSSFFNSLGANPSLTIQSISSQRSQSSSGGGPPNISITPLSNRPTTTGGKPSTAIPPVSAMRGNNKVKRDIVICEICDGYIKDLEQLKNHMQWIHKVQIHPKMIYNRPPLNCQKCQFRFFTDQGLERHLLGTHGLVTASMQDLANKNQDSGRCPICGKVYQWKLLNHVSRGHNKTLKPAHLSYKCTVCTETFEQYKLFETHVYNSHSSNKRSNNGEASQTSKISTAGTTTAQAKPNLPKQELSSQGVSILRKTVPASGNEDNKKIESSYESGDDIEEVIDDE